MGVKVLCNRSQVLRHSELLVVGPDGNAVRIVRWFGIKATTLTCSTDCEGDKKKGYKFMELQFHELYLYGRLCPGVSDEPLSASVLPYILPIFEDLLSRR